MPATVLARTAEKASWQVVGTTVFYRTSQGGVDSTGPPFAVDGRSRRHWMLRLDPRSGIGGPSAPGLRIGWQTQDLVFAPRGRAPFTLAFGKYQATPGALPIETLVPDYASKQTLPLGIAVVGTTARVDLGGATRLQKPPEVKQWALWGALLHTALAVLQIDKGHPYTFTSRRLRRFLNAHGFDVLHEQIEDYEAAKRENRRSSAPTDRIKGYSGLSEFSHSVVCRKKALARRPRT